MLHKLSDYFSTLPSVFIDGLIYVLLAMISAWLGIITSESARAFLGPAWIFWMSSFLVTSNAGLLALKMFRSTAFAEHQQNKKDVASFQTQQFLKQQTEKLAQGQDNESLKKF